MVKTLASKITKELLTETEIRDKKRNVGEFTTSWQGRVFVINPDESRVAEVMGIEKQGEYAIKVR